MTSKAEATFTVGSWNEDTYAEIDGGGRLTRADVKLSLRGDIEGECSTAWLMSYRPDETAEFVGHSLVKGSVGGHPGAFVLQSTGTFNGKSAEGAWTVVPGSGTDDLAGLSGQGGFSAALGSEPDADLSYEL